MLANKASRSRRPSTASTASGSSIRRAIGCPVFPSAPGSFGKRRSRTHFEATAPSLLSSATCCRQTSSSTFTTETAGTDQNASFAARAPNGSLFQNLPFARCEPSWPPSKVLQSLRRRYGFWSVRRDGGSGAALQDRPSSRGRHWDQRAAVQARHGWTIAHRIARSADNPPLYFVAWRDRPAALHSTMSATATPRDGRAHKIIASTLTATR
jgi:hypothetical protein